jgi:hypothetical protein
MIFRSTRLLVVLAALGSPLCGGKADAALLATEVFDYGTGSTLGAQSAAGDGWATGWMTNSALSAPSGASVLADSLLAPSGYAPVQSGGSAIQEAILLYRGLDTSARIDLSVDKDYYISYLSERTAVPITTRSHSLLLQTGGVVGGDTVVNVGTSTGGDPFAILGSSGTVVEDINRVGNGAPVFWVIKIAARAAAPDQVFMNVYNVSMEIDGTEPAAWDVVSNTESSDAVATQIGFAMGAGATLQIDEVRIGESWADVVPYQNPGLDGDLDDDGFVGISDLNVVLGNWNEVVTAGDLLLGDPSGDGFVGIEDLNTVLGNWNAGTPPVAVVPEPASVGLLAVCGVALLRRGAPA